MDGESSSLPENSTKSSNLKTHGKLEKISSSEHLEVDQSPSVNQGNGGDSSETDARMRILPDLNFYQNKKSLGTGMIDFALLVSNVNQLRYILNMNEKEHPLMYVSAGLVVTSIVLQIIVGVTLTVNCQYDIKDTDEVRKAEKCNNWTTVLIFLVTAINVVISGLGIADM